MPTASAPPAPVAEARPAPRAAPRWSGLAPRTLLAVVGGLLTWLAFPPYDLHLLAVVGPAALSLAVHGRGPRAGAWLGFALGLSWFAPLLHWSGTYVGAGPWLALAVFEAGYTALLGAAAARVRRLALWPLWVAALWVATEALRGRWPFGGFPWGRLGFAESGGPFTAFAAYGGVPAVSFAVALTGTLLAAAVLLGGRHRAGLTAGAVLGAAAALGALTVPLLGWAVPAGAGDGDTAGGDTGSGGVTVAVVQGNVPRAGLDFNAQRRAVLDNHVRETLALADRVDAGTVAKPDLVLWPENSSDIDPYRNADAAATIDTAARAVGVPILVGAVVGGAGDTLRNVGIVWDPVTGPGATYDKRHPVPFGEYLPWRSLVTAIAPVANRVSQDFVAGDAPGVLSVGGLTLGDVICFEVAYDGLVDDVVDGGAGVIVVQTNNATFGYSDETYQQLAMARLRAVEHARPVIVVSTSGVSAVIDAAGTVRWQTALFTADTVVTEVSVGTQRTLATRLGAGPEWVLAGVGLLALAGTARRRRPEPDSGATGAASVPGQP